MVNFGIKVMKKVKESIKIMKNILKSTTQRIFAVKRNCSWTLNTIWKRYIVHIKHFVLIFMTNLKNSGSITLVEEPKRLPLLRI